MVLGLGGGGLAAFLANHLHLPVTAVELDPRKGTAIPSTKGLLGDGSLKG